MAWDDFQPLDLDPEPASAFTQWRLVLEPGGSRATRAEEWAGALVLVERGTVRVDCASGGSETFAAGDQLALGCLPLRTLHNVGDGEVHLVAVRRHPRGEVRNDRSQQEG